MESKLQMGFSVKNLKTGDYFLDENGKVFKIIDVFMNYENKLKFNVKRFDTGFIISIYAEKLNANSCKYLGNNEKSAQVLYTLDSKQGE